jgi:hypothetical protein
MSSPCRCGLPTLSGAGNSAPVADHHPPGVGRAVTAFCGGLGKSEDGELTAGGVQSDGVSARLRRRRCSQSGVRSEDNLGEKVLDALRTYAFRRLRRADPEDRALVKPVVHSRVEDRVALATIAHSCLYLVNGDAEIDLVQ